jgi:hypothetical protein
MYAPSTPSPSQLQQPSCCGGKQSVMLLGQVSVESGLVVFEQTAPLSPDIFVGPSTGTPNMHNLYRSASIISTAFFIVVNSDPNVDASTEFCLLLNQMIGALLQNNRIPVCDRLVSVSPA